MPKPKEKPLTLHFILSDNNRSPLLFDGRLISISILNKNNVDWFGILIIIVKTSFKI